MPLSDPKIIVALDYSSASLALALAEQLDPGKCRLKVGKELYTSAGPSVVRALQQLGFEIFLDLKFHDIPNTAAKACAMAAELGVWMVNIHASGGRKMMERCVEAVDAFGHERPRLIGVTVLTSLSKEDLVEVGINSDPVEQVQRLAGLAQSCGLDGVVCSAQEAPVLRQEMADSFLLVTPGIRPKSASANDQKRIATPSEALSLGVDYLVIGRPITQASSPSEALLEIDREMTLWLK
ncbi:MAG: orotidine-5'-phosphate decarboxylase [Gammaproteobacteria bacterium]|nr:orotidine-5'-phosphate decarboxylase [Gammaproteobacteria bacterium]